MDIALIQMNITDRKADNLLRAAQLVRLAEGADAVILPEMFCCPYTPEAFAANAEPEGGAVTEALSRMAKENAVYLIGGSMPEREGSRIYNTCFVFDPAGKRIARCRKTHLFDVEIDGGQHYRESAVLSAGDGAAVFDTPFGRFGVCVCFDIRFPGYVHEMGDMDFLAVPAAFNMTTGPLHWELLLRARAVDEQIFTFGYAPARDENARYVSYANSIAVDPWGRVLARAGEEQTILFAEADRADALSVRRQIPVGKQGRGD